MSDQGNTVGKLYGQATMSRTESASANPPVKAETPEEESWLSKWWSRTEHELDEAMTHPGEAAKGAVKGIANIPSDLGEMLMKGGTLQSAGEMEQAAAMQSLFGQTESAEALMQSAQDVRASANSIELPKFKMSNPAQAGGDKIATAVSLVAGGAGLAKGGLKGLSALGKAGAVVEEGAEVGKNAATVGKALDSEKVMVDGAKAADAGTSTGKAEDLAAGKLAGNDGATVLERIKSLREQYLGRTPGKNSRTGREVQERMRAEGKLRDGPDGPEFKASDGEWYPLKDADMAHNTDAVKWWNETGRQYGAKAPEVRSWMLDSNNYTLDHYAINRSLGAQIGETYLPPLK